MKNQTQHSLFDFLEYEEPSIEESIRPTQADEIQIRAAGVLHGEVYCQCPNCDETKPIGEFGLRRMKGKTKTVIRNQSWCRQCRNEGKRMRH